MRFACVSCAEALASFWVVAIAAVDSCSVFGVSIVEVFCYRILRLSRTSYNTMNILANRRRTVQIMENLLLRSGPDGVIRGEAKGRPVVIY